MSQYRRSRVCGGTYFFTVNLLDRRSSLLIEHIKTLRESVSIVKNRFPFQIDAWVVLPDHLHAVWTLPASDSDYSIRWREIKKKFSVAIPKDEYRSPNRIRRSERGIWQRRFWEHTIFNAEDYKTHIDYVHINPLKHKLVDAVRDWPYSTFHSYVKKGLYTSDWCG